MSMLTSYRQVLFKLLNVCEATSWRVFISCLSTSTRSDPDLTRAGDQFVSGNVLVPQRSGELDHPFREDQVITKTSGDKTGDPRDLRHI